ncbi:MAG: hypothetical protein QGI49_10460 [SAR202 cluster bacterium]|nr:hypothetical protein [SAR202 cluster bacterium]
MTTNAMMDIAQAVKNARSVRRMMKPNIELISHSHYEMHRISTATGWAVALSDTHSLFPNVTEQLPSRW